MPTIRTTISQRAVEDDLLEGRRQDAREDGGAEHDRDDRAARPAATSRQPGWRLTASAQPRSASAGIPIGATRTLPAWAAPRLVSRPVLGRWNVTVRSAWTAGSDGSPLERSTAVGVSTATTGTPAARARPMSSTAERIGSRSGAAHAGPEQRVDDDRGLLDALAEHRDVAGDRRVDLGDPVSRAMRSQLRAAVAPRGRASAATTATMTWAPARASRRAATKPSPPLLPGPHRMTIGPRAPAIEVDGERADGGRDGGPGVLHQPLLGTPSAWARRSAPVIASAADRRQRRLRRPAAAQAAQVQLEDRRVVGGQRRSAGGVGAVGRTEVGDIGPASVADERSPVA